MYEDTFHRIVCAPCSDAFGGYLVRNRVEINLAHETEEECVTGTSERSGQRNRYRMG